MADPLRPGHETAWYPGEVNLRRAQVVVINKVNAAPPAAVEAVAAAVAGVNPRALQVRTASLVSVAEGDRVRGKRVLVIEDGPSVTHGSLPSGAGLVAAHRYGAAEVVDPRPWAKGSLAGAFTAWPHIGPVLPAMGYTPEQVADLAATIDAVPCDLVLAATPIDLCRVLTCARPVLRVAYRVSEIEGEQLREAFSRIIP